MAIDIPELSPRELAVRFTDTQGYFILESSVYRLLKAHDLISSPAFIVMKAASEFKDKTTAINQMSLSALLRIACRSGANRLYLLQDSRNFKRRTSFALYMKSNLHGSKYVIWLDIQRKQAKLLKSLTHAYEV